MPKFAVINNTSKKVINTIIWDGSSPWSCPADHTLVSSDGAGVGDSYDSSGGTFAKPNGSTVYPDKVCLPAPLNLICFPILG